MVSPWDDSGWYQQQGAFNPGDPYNTGSPEDRVRFLSAAGFTWVQGNGNSALWQAPNGEVMAEPAAVQAVATGGVPQAPRQTAPNPASSPDIRYNAQGQAQQWDGRSWVPAPQFDDFTKAAGYRAPSTAQPRAPQYVTDPRTGQLVEAGPGVQVDFPGISPQEKATQDAQRRMDEIMAQQRFTSTENATERAARAQESAYDRALRIAQDAASQELGRATLAQRASEAAAQQKLAENQQTQRERMDYANLVSSTDTAALPAYLQAGGGNYFNANKANPGGALTNNALGPAASILRAQAERAAAEQAAANAPRSQPSVGFDPRSMYSANSPYRDANRAIGTAQTITGNGQMYDWVPGKDTPQLIGGGFNSQGQHDPSAVGAYARAAGTPQLPSGTPQWVQGLGGTSASNYGTQPGFATGTPQYGFIPAPQQGFITGERGPEFQQVIDPPGANNAQLKVVPGFAFGTDATMKPADAGYAAASAGTQPAGAGSINPAADPNQMAVGPLDQPYIEQVRAFRQSRAPLNVGFSQFDPRFSRQVDPTLREAYFRNEQTRLGVPAASLAFEASRYTPRGAARGFSTGY